MRALSPLQDTSDYILTREDGIQSTSADEVFRQRTMLAGQVRTPALLWARAWLLCTIMFLSRVCVSCWVHRSACRRLVYMHVHVPSSSTQTCVHAHAHVLVRTSDVNKACLLLVLPDVRVVLQRVWDR